MFVHPFQPPFVLLCTQIPGTQYAGELLFDDQFAPDEPGMWQFVYLTQMNAQLVELVSASVHRFF